MASISLFSARAGLKSASRHLGLCLSSELAPRPAVALFRQQSDRQTNSIRQFSNTSGRLSGHSRWSTIKHGKAAHDSARAAIATKHSRLIISAAKIGGPDPENNPRLWNAIENAKRNQVPKKTIESALRRAAGISDKDGKQLESVTYEASGPGGCAIIIEALTDNKSRTVGFVRNALTKSGCSLGPSLFYFDRKGLIRIVRRTGDNASEIDFDEIFEHALEAGAEDIKLVEDYFEEDDPDHGKPVYEIVVEQAETAKVAQEMKDSYGYEIKEMGIEYIPKEDSEIELDEGQELLMQKLMGLLDEVDEVQEIYTNAK
ncbi:transcriptional regulator TACO1-like protein [Myxozyma melibiosi]|uniref:Transcriptional regulator TACO1-like protein n=1 Tax=Myxozyma melibiosi TaxID=54550 RepID=A0ABR1F8M3_9ASCO